VKTEFYKMEYEAWDEGCVGLSLELEAAYLRLCHQMYRRRGPVVDNIESLGRLWCVHPNKARALLRKLISAGKIRRVEGSKLSNARVTTELDLRHNLSTRRAHAANTRWTQHRDSNGKCPENMEPDDAGA
jgi:uncharacterized protein YdaU (DUF1376 family)